MPAQAQVLPFFDAATATYTYLVHDGEGGRAAVIDPVLDFDPKSGRTATRSADQVIEAARRLRLNVDWILETHAHADHLSAAPHVQRALGGRIAIGDRIGTVQRTFRDLFNLGDAQPVDGRPFDHLFAPDETFRIGALEAQALFVPGHTPACVAYRIDDAVFVGDTLFMPDVGTARADFPGGDASALYRSIRRLLALPEATRLFVCHDYPPTGRAPRCETTVAEQRASNIHVHDGIDEDAYVAMRTTRDAGLEMPTLLLASIQVNLLAGQRPAPESNGVSYLKLPLDAL
ncbi:MAG: MBL fold metallo-hydrolase [Burkholderiaceae bacterium]